MLVVPDYPKETGAWVSPLTCHKIATEQAAQGQWAVHRTVERAGDVKGRVATAWYFWSNQSRATLGIKLYQAVRGCGWWTTQYLLLLCMHNKTYMGLE